MLVENYRPDVKDRLGIGYEAMAAVNPRLIYASISGFGEDGPYRVRPGFDQIAQGMGGLMSITGLPGQGPVRVGIPIADLCAGIFCAHGIMVALVEREKSGKGQWVKSSLLQAQLFMLDFQAARWLMRGEVAKQAGNNHPTSIPTGVYRTRDGYINIAVSGTKIWTRMCEAIGAQKLATHADYSTSALRSKNRDRCTTRSRRHFAERDTAAWIEILNEAGVPSRADLLDRPGVRRPAGRSASAWCRRSATSPYLRPTGDAVAHPEPRVCASATSRASTRIRSCMNWATRTARSPTCERERNRVCMPSDKLIAKKENGVGWIILNNPERHNAISLEMWTGAMEAMQDFRADKSVRVVVVTGAGGKAFVSGRGHLEVQGRAPGSRGRRRTTRRRRRRPTTRCSACRFPPSP